MKVKVSEASGPVLDWLVATCLYSDEYDKDRVFLYHSGFDWAKHTVRVANQNTCTYDLSFQWEPSTDWAQGGPIIDRERIATVPSAPHWVARIKKPVDPLGDWLQMNGPTPLIAAMRCYVASKLGEEVEVPDELTP